SMGSAVVAPGVGSGVTLYPANARPRYFTVAGGEEYRGVDFTIAPAALYSVSGKVELPEAKQRFWVALSSPDQPSLATAVAQTDPDGSFLLDGVQPGAYTLYASGPSTARNSRGGFLARDRLYGTAKVQVGAENIAGISIAVHKGRSAAFLLRSRSSAPAESYCSPNARLTLTGIDDWAAVLDRSVPAVFGKEIRVDDLAPARYQVGITDLGPACYQAMPLTIDLSRGESPAVEIAVAPAAVIRGKLTGEGESRDIA